MWLRYCKVCVELAEVFAHEGFPAMDYSRLGMDVVLACRIKVIVRFNSLNFPPLVFYLETRANLNVPPSDAIPSGETLLTLPSQL